MKNVVISIKGTQQGPDEEKNTIEFETDGRYSFEDGVARFDYEESEITGMEGTLTALEVAKECVTITRTGTVNSQMVFILGEKNHFMYNTAFGSASIGLDTRTVRADFGETGGSLEMRYQLDADGRPISRNELQIQIREV